MRIIAGRSTEGRERPVADFIESKNVSLKYCECKL